MNRLQTIPRFPVPYGLGDACAALGRLFDSAPPAATGFDHLLGDRPKFWTGSGRQALWLLLKALDLPPGAGVAIPLYTDLSVIDTIQASGCTPVFVDTDETLTMDPCSLARQRTKIAAVVPVHLFGHVAPIDEIREAAGDIPLIEDTVHAPLSFLGERHVGTMGVGCFYSFASSKCIPAGGGGLLVLNDPELAPRVEAAIPSLMPQPLAERFRNVIFQTVKSALFRPPLYGIVARPLRNWAERYALLEPGLDRRAIQPGQAAVAMRQARTFAEKVETQRRNSMRLLDELRDVKDIVLPFERSGCRYNFHFFPILVRDTQERDGVIREMLSRHVDTSRVYFNVVEHARAAGYQGECPVAESASQRMLSLPNYAGLSRLQLDRIAEVFIQSLAAYRSGARRLASIVVELPVRSSQAVADPRVRL